MPLQPTPPIKKANLTIVQWEEKLKEFAQLFAKRHDRSPDMWRFYTPEAELHMSRTYTKNPASSWAIPEEETTR